MWKDTAVAVEQRQGEAVIVCEGTLARVIATLKTVRPARLGGIRVSLPDRHTSPYSFDGWSLQALLDDAARPQSTLLPLLAAYVS
jgi:hypothetical protein